MNMINKKDFRTFSISLFLNELELTTHANTNPLKYFMERYNHMLNNLQILIYFIGDTPESVSQLERAKGSGVRLTRGLREAFFKARGAGRRARVASIAILFFIAKKPE